MAKAVVKTKETSRAIALATERNLDFMTEVAKAVAQTSNIVGKLLRYQKGVFVAGAGEDEDDEVELGTRMVVNIDNILHGWQRWEDNRIVDTDMGLLVKAFQPKRREDLSFPPDASGKNADWPENSDGKSADPWQFFFIVLMKDADSGQLYTFSTCSQGGRSALGKMLVKAVEHMQEDNSMYPVVELGSESYKHSNPAYGRVHKPTFNIVDWSPIDEFGETTEVEAGAEPVKAKAKPAAPAHKAPAPKSKPKSKPMSMAGKGANSKSGSRRSAQDLSYE
jgi:hypothetical protein